MSYDFALQKLCSHEIRMETALYDNVNNAVRLGMPPVNQKIDLWINGEKVPQSGLWSKASVAFLNQAPYRISRGQNDLLYVKVGNGPPAFVQLLTGNVKSQDLAKDLSRKIPELRFSARREKIVVESMSPSDRGAFSFVDPRWTDKTESLPTTARVLAAYDKLGIVPGRVVSSRMLFPPWTVEKFARSDDEYEKVIQFHDTLLNSRPVIHVSYVTYANYCRRCSGSRMEFDYSIVNNSYERVSDADLLAQEFDKFLFTKLGSHWKWPWLGSRVMDRVGGKGSSAQVTASSMLTLDVGRAFSVYQNIKSQQSQNFTQDVTDAEYPLTIKSVNVSTLPNDPTVALMNIVIICRSAQPIALRRIVGNPNPYMIGAGLGAAVDPAFLLRG